MNSFEKDKKIIITSQELAEPGVDEALARQEAEKRRRHEAEVKGSRKNRRLLRRLVYLVILILMGILLVLILLNLLKLWQPYQNDPAAPEKSQFVQLTISSRASFPG